MGKGGGGGMEACFLIFPNNYPDCQSLQGNPSCVFLSKHNGERSLGPDVISSEPEDECQKFKRSLEAEKILHNLYRIDF